MADMVAGLGNINSQIMNSYNNKINIGSFNQEVMDYSNVNKLNNFLTPGEGVENPELLKGIVTKIQQGQKLEEPDFKGLSDNDSQLAKDLQSLVGSSGQKITGIEGGHSSSGVVNEFSNMLDRYLTNVNDKHKNAAKAVETFATGGDIDLHSVMIASEKASLSMNLTLQLRNKLMQAYKEIQNVRV